MTTGSYTQGVPFGTGAYRSKTFNGTDGKYEVIGGRRRVKWNAYTLRYFENTSQQGQLTNTVGATGSGIPEWPPEAEFALQSKLVKKVKGHRLNLAVSVTQGKQVVDMAVNTIRRMTAALVLLKRGRFGDAMRQLGARNKKGVKDVTSKRLDSEALSKAWLERRYGWGPLLSDVYEATSAYARLTAVRRNTISTSHEYWNPKTNWASSPTLYVCEGTRITTTYLKYEIEEELSAARSLGLLDPASLVWEWMPWSFVFDWFLPIGTYLDNLNVIPTLKGRFLMTRVCEYGASFSRDLTPGKNYTPTTRGWYGKGVDRLAAVVGLSTQRPGFTPLPETMNGSRIFDAVALAHQVVQKVLR